MAGIPPVVTPPVDSNTPDQPAGTEPSGTARGMGSAARVALRGAVWVTIGNYVTQLIGFAAMLVMARLLAPEIFGYFALAGFWSGLLSLRGKAGLNFAAVQQRETTGDLLGTYFAVDGATTVGSILLAVVASIAFSVLGYPPQVILIFLALMCTEVIALLVSPLSMALEREIQISRLALVTLVGYLVAYAIAIAFALAGRGIWALLSINLVYGVIAALGVYVVSRQRVPQVFRLHWRFDRTLARQLLSAGILAGFSATTLSIVVGQFDNFLIGTFVSVTTLGFYDRAYRIAQWPNILVSFVISKAAFLTFAKVKDDLSRLTHTVRLTLWALTSLSVVISLWLFFSASELISVLFTEKWLPSTPFLRFLSITNLLWGYVSLGFWLSVALGHRRATITLSAIQAVTLVVLATPLTLMFGSNGTLAGVGASMLVGSVASFIYVFRRVSLTPREVFARPLIAAGLTIGVLWALTSYAGWSGLPPIVRTVLVGIVAAVTLIGALFMLSPSEMIDRIRYLTQTWRRA